MGNICGFCHRAHSANVSLKKNFTSITPENWPQLNHFLSIPDNLHISVKYQPTIVIWFFLTEQWLNSVLLAVMWYVTLHTLSPPTLRVMLIHTTFISLSNSEKDIPLCRAVECGKNNDLHAGLMVFFWSKNKTKDALRTYNVHGLEHRQWTKKPNAK